jgi:diamine N-acetyltransferase
MSQPILVEVRDDAALAECVAVIREAFQTVLDDFGFTEAQVPTNAAFLTLDRLRAASDRGDRVFALRVAGRTVGSVSVRTGADPAVVGLERLAVAPPARHRGYGGLLLAGSHAIAAGMGATSMRVGIIEANTVLKRWYERHGFVVLGQRVFDHLPFTVCYLHRAVVGGGREHPRTGEGLTDGDCGRQRSGRRTL